MEESTEWRQSTHSEIKYYYNEIFPHKITELPWWVTPNGPEQYALSFRKKYPACRGGDEVPPKNFIRRDTRSSDNPNRIFISDWNEIVDFIQHPAKNDPMGIATNRSSGLLHPENDTVNTNEPAPEAVYYALDNWDEFWVLAFDIDAKDIAKQEIATDQQSFNDITTDAIETTDIITTPPTTHNLSPENATSDANGNGTIQEYPYTFDHIEKTIKHAFKLKDWLENTVNFTEVRIFYSGQGTHVYAFKDDPLYKFTKQTRSFLVTYIQEKLKIPVDGAVTWDQSRVMRLPYSLHTGVNRVMTEITTPNFDFKTQPLVENVANKGEPQ